MGDEEARAMEAREELLTFAEVAIAIAGFSGVVGAFLQRDGLHWVDRVRFVGILGISFAAFALAFVPIVLSHLGWTGPALWSGASVVMIVFWAVCVAPLPFVMPRLRREDYFNSRVFASMVAAPALLNLGLQLANAFGLLLESGVVAYLLGLFIFLYTAGVLFVIAIVFRPAEGTGVPPPEGSDS
jgi:hypothetical protein